MNRLIRKIKLRYTTQVLLLLLEKEVISRVVYRDEGDSMDSASGANELPLSRHYMTTS